MSIKEECDRAIIAHAAWKSKFRAFLAGTLALDPKLVEKNDACDFGKWLEGDGRAHLLPAEYERLHDLHVRFHTVAASVVRLKLSDDHATAQAAVERAGVFTRASAQLTSEVIAVRDARRGSPR